MSKKKSTKNNNDSEEEELKEAELIDWYKQIPKKFITKSHNPNFKIHGLNLPFRAIMVAGSGSGKTETCLNLIHNFGKTFNKIFAIVANKDEPLYNFLEEKLGKDGSFVISEGLESIPDLDKDIDKTEQTLIIFDDLVLEKNQKSIEQFFIRSRKLNCSCIYISQSYFGIPSMIRKNTNYIFIKKMDQLTDLFRILREYTLGVDKEKLKKIYEKAVEGSRQNFLLIDLQAPVENRFRRNFNEIFEI
jgi:hypothetical protein